MAYKPTRVDDVLAADGKDVVATSQRKIKIPGTLTPTGRPSTVTLDVSPAGEVKLDKLLKDAQEATERAWGPILAILEHAGLGPRPATEERTEESTPTTPENATPPDNAAPDTTPFETTQNPFTPATN